MELSTIVVGVMGGLGMFLLGMSLMTEGLKAMAGDAIRTSLRRVTRSPFSGAVIGFVGTAVLQSSSAAVIATIGFVGAGLLSFYQALSIILGSRSEEHTSELQSRGHLVCRLLLETKTQQ